MRRATTTLAITSGKGGVGKSVVAVNLAEVLAARGHRVALIDADFGQGACALLMNETPEAAVIDVVRHRARREQVLYETLLGVTLVQAVAEPGTADGREHALYEALDALLADLRRTHDLVLIDTPAGADGPVRWALDRADLGLLVLADEPTAIADAYRLVKLTWTADPDLPLAALVNFADSEDDARSVADRFAEVTGHFLHQAPPFLGWVPFSAQIRKSVRRQQPAARFPGRVQDAFVHLADVLVEGRLPVAAPTVLE